MKIKHKLRFALDNLFKGYYLEKYILKDGKNHPVAIICPGGGYHRVCSFIEGLPYAKIYLAKINPRNGLNLPVLKNN